MSAHPQSSLRLLAPVALTVFAIVFLIVVVTSLGGEGDTSDGDRTASTTSQRERGRDRAQRRERRERRRTPSANARFYTVRPGDNLALIADRTGISLEELRTLNPTLDPQALVTGQRVRLRASAGATGASGATGAQGQNSFEGDVTGE